MDKSKFKKYLPYLVAIALFAVISSLYCLPVFQGKVIYTGDDIQVTSAIQEPNRYHAETGNYTWWTGSMFSGMPNYQVGGGKYLSAKLMRPLIKVLHPSSKKMPLVFIMFFTCFFILMRSFKVDKWLSIVGALATGFSSYFFIIEAAGHNGKAWSIALMSVVLGGFYLIYSKRYGAGVALTMVFTAMGFYPHLQMTYYMFMLIGVLFFAELYIHIKEKRYKDFLVATLLFAASVGIGMGTGSANIFSTKNSNFSKALVSKGASKAVARQYSQSAPVYWGEQPFTVGSVYAGAAVCFLFLLGLLLVKGPYKWGLLIATCFSFALSWGRNWMGLTELFFNWFPLYDKFRSVSSILIVAEITMPLLGFLAVKQIMDGKIEKERVNKSIYIAAGVTGGICLVLALFGGSMFSFTSSYDAQHEFPDWLYAALIDDRAAMLRSDSFRSLLFVLATAAVVWLFSNGKLKSHVMVLLLGVIVIADMWPVDRRFLNDSNYVTLKQNQSGYAMQPYEKAILADTDPHFRVMNLTVRTFNDARTSYYLKSLGGYCAAKLRRYQDIIDMYLSKVDIDVISMLNGKYIITQDNDGQVKPMRNPGALGNAWFVDSIVTVSGAAQECDAIGQVNLRNTAVVGEDFAGFISGFRPGHDASASIKLNTYAPDVLTYTSNSSADGVAVFSEIYYPYGWNAYIDGKKVELFRVNYLLRALNIPAGQHEIRMEFRPESVRKGNILSGIFIGIMYATVLGLIAGTLIKRGRQRKSA